MKRALVVCVGLLGITGCAQPEPPGPPTLTVKVTPDPASVGERLTFGLELSSSGLGQTPQPRNVALFVESPEGTIEQLLPNRLSGGAPTLAPGQRATFPAAEARYVLEASPPTGVYTALAYASAQPLNLTDLSRYTSAEASFATVNPVRMGRGSLEASFLAILKLQNPGLSALSKFTIR